ncbi:hypothetical protein [Schaalia suimastitidis]|uniref:hypothetical protein n=1 Tax=Schaalia suimastitidis TaxID=121163 RepID=UPI00047E73EA|nr:hypothetical protein [Schaalia suimastitidis]
MTSTNVPGRSIICALQEAFFGSPTAPLQLSAMRGPLIPEAVCRAAGVTRLAELGKREVAQKSISTLSDTTALVTDLRFAIESRQLLWVIPAHEAYEREWLISTFPALAMPLDNDQTVWGINVYKLTSRLLAQDHDMRTHLSGVDVTSTPMKLRVLLHDHRVHTQRSSMFTRVLHDPRTWVYLAIFIYSALRALPVVWVPQFHGNVALLWTIDIVTAIPYTWGILAMLTATNTKVRILGTVTTIVTFMAPYIYFWSFGKDYPPLVIGVVTAMIVGSIAIEASRVIQDKRLQRLYASARFPALIATH